MPVYDAALGRVVLRGRAVDPAWGEKALAVNALLAENLPTAGALLVIQPNARGDFHSDPRFLALLEKTFPRFGQGGDGELMVRASLHSTFRSAMLTGLFKSPTVTSPSQLASAIENQLSQWRKFRLGGGEIELTIIVQERVRSKASGLLATGPPWDSSAKGLVAALTPIERNRAATVSYQVLLEEDELLNLAPTEVARRLPGRFAPVLPSSIAGGSFGGRFLEFLLKAMALSDRYAVPLELEFVMTDECEFRLVQFRPLSYVEQAGPARGPAWRKNA
jgi:hypothetical protein